MYRGHPFITWKNKKIFPVSAWVGSQSFVWLYECLYIVKEGLCAFFEFDWTTANNYQPKFEKSKMADVTAAEFTELEDRVKVVMGNLDQMFLLVMGCLIFCEYVFFVLCYSLKSFFAADIHNTEIYTLHLSKRRIYFSLQNFNLSYSGHDSVESRSFGRWPRINPRPPFVFLLFCFETGEITTILKGAQVTTT